MSDGLDKIRERAESALKEVQEIAQPIRDMEQDQWSKTLSVDEAGDLGPVELSGSLSVGAYLTRRAEAPLDLAALAAGKAGEAEATSAWASFVLEGSAKAGFSTSEPITNGSLEVGAEAEGRAALAHHRRFTPAKHGLTALTELAGDLRVPQDVEAARTLAASDVLEVDLGGSIGLHASAGWTYGLVREIETSAFDALDLADPVAIRAGVKASLSFVAKLEGTLRVVVRSGEEPGHVRVQLHKKTGSLVGAGLKLSGGLRIHKPDAFADGLVDKVLRLPDGLVDELRTLRSEVNGLEERLSSLQADVKKQIADAAGKASSQLGLDDLAELIDKSETLPAALRGHLEPFVEPIQSLLGKIESLQDELTSFVDDAFTEAKKPFGRVSSKLGEWIEKYETLRKKVSDVVTEHVKKGIAMDFAAGINRTRASEALLELDFDLNLGDDSQAVAAYRSALSGSFVQALVLADAKGIHGVELESGTLKTLFATTRFANLKLDLFGFEIARDMSSKQELIVKEDVVTGTLTVVGQAGAKLWSKKGKQIRDLSFVFDLVSGAEKRGGRIYLTDPEVGYRATLSRGSELTDEPAAKAIPLHVAGARELSLLGPEAADRLETDLLAATGAYRYRLELTFPPAALGRIFLLDSSLGRKELRATLRRTFRTAVERLEMVVPRGNSPLALSPYLIEASWQQVQSGRPDSVMDFRAPSLPGVGVLQKGAQRLIGVYLLEGHRFIEGYLEAREALLEGKPARKIGKALRTMTVQVSKGTGAVGVKPLDAKYLTLALLAGPEVEVKITFSRGSGKGAVDVTV